MGALEILLELADESYINGGGYESDFFCIEDLNEIISKTRAFVNEGDDQESEEEEENSSKRQCFAVA